MEHKVVLSLGGRELSIETGKIAKQADGAVVVRYGDTVVIVAAVCELKPKENLSFFPLTCDYREYTYAAGKIPGGFFKREGRPTERETLTSRLMDRPIRPLFPEGFRYETQVIARVHSAEPDANPDILGLVGASAALFISDIPFHTPIGAVRVGRIRNEFVINPSQEALSESDLNLVMAGSEDGIVMVEAGAKQVTEEEMVEALEFGHKAIREVVGIIRELAEKSGRPKRTFERSTLDPEIVRAVEDQSRLKIVDALNTKGKLAGEAIMSSYRDEAMALYPEDDESARTQASKAFNELKEKIFRRQVLENRERPDGRRFDEVRAISTEVGLLPRVHGSALFTRGETQALVGVTLGTEDDAQRIDDLSGEGSKKFMLHYNFPPFSVGETGFIRGPGRREIGHGVLAERAILPVLPPDNKFPYTIRVVSDILESNGSSSMASVCGGVMALQDAGVPIDKPVAGIAMGLVKEGEKYAVLSDIAGFEDHYGDMDFKVTGTDAGITALQMDIKITGVTRQILSEALQQARQGRLLILQKMAETLSEPRSTMSEYAPRITTLTIPVAKIGEVIGPGGKMIRSIIEETGVKIDIEDDGTVKIASTDQAASDKAVNIIEELTARAEPGKTYLGKITKVVDFGAFVEIFKGTEGLLHISEIADRRISDIRSEVQVGDKILVKCLSVDDQNKIRLSRKAVLREQQQS